MTECPVCGSEDLYEITALDQSESTYLCRNGHRSVDVRFRAHAYVPVLRYVDPRDMVLVVSWDAVPSETSEMPPIRLIHCGPPAPYPAVPTPEDILHGAGLDPDLY